MKQAVFCLILLVSCTSGSLATPPAAAKEEIGVRETDGLWPEHELLYQQMLRYHRITHDRTFRAANPQQGTETARERTALRKQLIPQIATVFAPLAEGILPPFGKQPLTDPKTRAITWSALPLEFSKFPADCHRNALMLIFEHSPPSCRGDIVTLFLYDSDIGFTRFHSPPIQKWLMRVIRQGVPATAFYFILTEKNAAEVERGAWMDVLRFSKPNGNCPANRQALVRLAFLASRNSKKAVRLFETLLKKRDIQTPTDDSLLFPAIALSGNRTLLEKLPDIIRTDERQRFNGLDAIPQSFSFAHEAAAACSMAIEGFPLIDHWESFTEEKRHMAIDWLSRHPDYTIKPDIRRIFTDSSLSVMIPDQAEALRAIGELSD